MHARTGAVFAAVTLAILAFLGGPAAAHAAQAAPAAPATPAAQTARASGPMCVLTIPDGTVYVNVNIDSAGTSLATVTLTYRWDLLHVGHYVVDKVWDEDGVLRGPAGPRYPGTVERWTPYRSIDVNTGGGEVEINGHGGSAGCRFGI